MCRRVSHGLKAGVGTPIHAPIRRVHMSDMAEDRVYEGDAPTTPVYVAARVGIVRVETVSARVGEFGLVRRCTPRDVASGPAIAVATDEDVIVGGEDGFEPTGFGDSIAVGFRGDAIVAAGPEGRIATLAEGAWHEVDVVEPPANAVDGDLVATDEAVYRVEDGYELTHEGLRAVRDVASTGQPLAATRDGLYTHRDAWERILEGSFTVAASSPDGVAHAATRTGLFVRGPDQWAEVELPVDEPVVDLDYGDDPVAVTGDGVLLLGDDQWRGHALGVPDVVGVAVL